MKLNDETMRRRGRAAMTLIEVVVAVTILAVVTWGAVMFSMQSRVSMERTAEQRAAAQVAHEQFERARALGYSGVAAGSGTIVLNNTTYSWTRTVASVQADPADSGSLYKQVDITVTWPTSTRGVTLRTGVAP